MKAKLLNAAATLLMLAVVLAALPLTVPRVMGYRIYHVLTDSMAPALPVGSAIYVKECEPALLETGEIVTFTLGSATDLVETHRVVENDTAAKQLVTKGDANAQQDAEPVSYGRIVGKVTLCVPHLGEAAEQLQSRTGMIACVVVFVLAGLLWALADKCKERENRK